jgi:2-polyprenyl-3-methyl-5-hydroxy-6-metoxy-1,4-benzoquinol methylase
MGPTPRENTAQSRADSVSLLAMSEAPAFAGPLSPWHGHNLRVVGQEEDDEGRYVRYAVDNPERNGHLVQWCDLDAPLVSSEVDVTAVLWAEGEGAVGLNIYLYFHPEEDEDRKVYQLQHPGDGKWHRLSRSIPAQNRPIHRIQAMVVARTGADGFLLRNVELRSVGKASAGTARGNIEDGISETYRQAVEAMVSRHPSASDPKFREKLTRYLLGANRKGIRTVADIERRIGSLGGSVSGRRFLDLGSGTGGSLVGALKAGAAYCEGWEINSEKLALSEVNTRTCGMEMANVLVRSFSMETPEALGDDFQPFDVVFCEEVLEHVKELDAALVTLARCINRERGVGYVTMPNGFSLASVLADPHLELFGIALLDRFEAQPLATALKNHTHYSDMMGAYCRHDDYVARFAEVGLSVVPVEEADATPKALRSMRRQLDRLQERRENLRRDWGDMVECATLDLLEKRLDIYIGEVSPRFEAATAKEASEFVCQAFARDYGQAHFKFLVTHER